MGCTFSGDKKSVVLKEARKPLCSKYILIGEDESHSGHHAFPKTGKTKEIIQDALLQNGIFLDEINMNSISKLEIDQLIDTFTIETIKRDEHLYMAGDKVSDHLDIMLSGSIKIVGINSNFYPGDIIGDLGFFLDVPQNVSIFAYEESKVFRLSKCNFRMIAEKGRDIRNIKILDPLSDEQKLMFKERVTLVEFSKGDVILRRESLIQGLYIIISGVVAILDSEKSLTSSSDSADTTMTTMTLSQVSMEMEAFVMLPGEYFGEERYLLKNEVSSQTYVAAKPVTVCVIEQDLFDDYAVFGPTRDLIAFAFEARIQAKERRKKRFNTSRRDSPVSVASLPKTDSLKSDNSAFAGILCGLKSPSFDFP